MAKQTGIIALRGKIKGQSYYGSKVGGDLVRTINEGMSARVKTAKEYVNTRKNNSEFGMCGDFAGSIIKPITQRWRFILDSIATGKMVKAMKELAVLDSTSEWGKRGVKLANYGTIYEKFNSFSKNEIPAELANVLGAGVTYASDTNKVQIPEAGTITQSFIDEMTAIGADHYSLLVYGLNVAKPTFDATAGVYSKAISTLTYVSAMSQNHQILEVGEDLLADNNGSLLVSPVNTESVFGGLLVVLLPEKTIGGQANILQQHCSAYMVPVTAAV